jgi:hypothetical protein
VRGSRVVRLEEKGVANTHPQAATKFQPLKPNSSDEDSAFSAIWKVAAAVKKLWANKAVLYSRGVALADPVLSIQGGRYGNGNSGGLHASLTQRRQPSYNMTLCPPRTAVGGADMGVFSNEKVYTVYLDMKADTKHRLIAQ